MATEPLQGRFWMYLADSMARGKENKEEVERMRRLALEIEPDNYDLMLRLATQKVGKGKKIE